MQLQTALIPASAACCSTRMCGTISCTCWLNHSSMMQCCLQHPGYTCHHIAISEMPTVPSAAAVQARPGGFCECAAQQQQHLQCPHRCMLRIATAPHVNRPHTCYSLHLSHSVPCVALLSALQSPGPLSSSSPKPLIPARVDHLAGVSCLPHGGGSSSEPSSPSGHSPKVCVCSNPYSSTILLSFDQVTLHYSQSVGRASYSRTVVV